MLAHRELCAHRYRGRVVLPVAFAVLIMLVANSAMAYVSGYNAFLEQSQGRAFIPQKAQTSGVLGEVKNGRIVGAKVDIITLRRGDVSQGSLTYDLLFDLALNFDEGQPVQVDPADVDTTTMDLFLDLTDIDFVPVTGAGRTYSESLGLKLFSADKSVELTDPSLNFLIDAINYGTYRGDGFGPTNNTQARYAINLDSNLGLQADDFYQIFTDMGFTLEVTITSTTLRTAAGVGSYRNTAEYLGDYSTDNDVGEGGTGSTGLDFEIIPEPMTLSLLGLGAVGLLWQRRR